MIIVFLLIKIFSQPIRLIIVSLIVLLSGIEIYQDMRQLTREPWRDLAGDLKQLSQEDDVFVVAAGFCIENILNHYTTNLPQKRIGVLSEDMEDNDWQMQIDLKSTQASKSVWLIISHFSNHEKELIAWFAQQYPLAEKFEYVHRDIFGRQYVGLKMIRYLVENN
jgi:Ni,Fe-hydrogenase III component G